MNNPDLIPLVMEWTVPDDLEPKYAHTFVVQHTQHEFTLSFFQARLPILTGTTEENDEVLKSMGYKVEGKCIAQIVLSPSKMREFLSAMAENFMKYNQSFGNPQKDE